MNATAKPSATFGAWRRTEVVKYHNRRKTVHNLDAEIREDLRESETTNIEHNNTTD
jgi:hypothetical protein